MQTKLQVKALRDMLADASRQIETLKNERAVLLSAVRHLQTIVNGKPVVIGLNAYIKP